MNTTYKIKQADSLWLDYICDNFTEVNPTWTDWSGSWAITEAPLGVGVTRLSGSLVRSATEGTFQLRIGPNADGVLWTELPVGLYFLNFQINSNFVDFHYEDNDRLLVMPQGII